MENELRFEVKLTARDLWKFSMYHANGGFMGIFNLIFTVAALFLLIIRFQTFSNGYRLLLLVCVLMFTVWQPLLLYHKARRQAKSPAVTRPMTLVFHQAGLMVTQNEQTAEFAWDQLGRIDRVPSMVVIYMDRIHAYLLPKTVMGDQEEALYDLVRTHLPKERRRRI